MEVIEKDIQQKVLDEIEDIKKNDLTLCLRKTFINKEHKPKLCAKPLEFKSLGHLGRWLLQIYDHMFEDYEHSVVRII